MSTSGDNGSWEHQRSDIYGQQPEQDPDQQVPAEGAQGAWEQPQDPWGQPQDPWAQPPAEEPAGHSYGEQQPQDPYGQSDPYGQPGTGPSSGPSASDPYGQGVPTVGPTGGPAFGQQPPGYAAAGAAQAPLGEMGQSRLLVGLLGIFLGAFGVHRFLMGYTTIGIIQVCITVLSCGMLSWISGIWGLIEGIMVLAKSEQFQRDAHGRPLAD